ncbi:MAG: shikimate kinase [Candidatus Nanopelagicaceae bacterium]|nr:shikimate kinase [Candidatus Nanopelagicaceae bacterium]
MSSKIVLIGPPGSGKTSVGKILAEELDLQAIDTDREIEKKSGKKIGDIFLEVGESGFRKIEREVVLDALKRDGSVISLGGGSILDSEVFEQLSGEPQVVYLEVSISNAAPRVGFNTDRPLLLANPRQQWLKLFEERKDRYESLARYRIKTDNKKAKESALEIKEMLS